MIMIIVMIKYKMQYNNRNNNHLKKMRAIKSK